MNLEKEIEAYSNGSSDKQIMISIKYLMQSIKFLALGNIFWALPGLIPGFDILNDLTDSPFFYWLPTIVAVFFFVRAANRISIFMRISTDKES